MDGDDSSRLMFISRSTFSLSVSWAASSGSSGLLTCSLETFGGANEGSSGLVASALEASGEVRDFLDAPSMRLKRLLNGECAGQGPGDGDTGSLDLSCCTVFPGFEAEIAATYCCRYLEGDELEVDRSIICDGEEEWG